MTSNIIKYKNTKVYIQLPIALYMVVLVNGYSIYSQF